MNRSTEVRRLTRNQHNMGSARWKIWHDITRAINARSSEPATTVTVGEIIDVAATRNVSADTVISYLRYASARGFVELIGEPAPRARMPRDRAPAVLPGLGSSIQDYTFGCELECFLPRGVSHAEAARRLTAEGLDVRAESWGHVTRTWWKIVTDGSLNNYTRGAEFVSPVLKGQEGLGQVEKLCRALTRMGAKVNKTCGLHVHVGAANITSEELTRLLKLYGRNERTIDRLMPESRRNNRYCGSVIIPERLCETVQEVLQAIRCTSYQSNRFRKLNAASWWSHRTVEFRQHSGSVEADKVCNWVQFCLYMTRFAASGATVPEGVTLGELFSAIELPGELQSFYFNRADRIAAEIARRSNALNRRAA